MDTCPRCGATAHTTGAPIQHRRWCTNKTPPRTRSAKMSLPRTPPPEAAPPSAAATPASASVPSPEGAEPGTGDAAAANVEILQQELDQLKTSLGLALEREKNLVASQQDLTLTKEHLQQEVRLGKDRILEVEQELGALKDDNYTISLERDVLKQATVTPGRQPPLPNSMQAVLDMSERHHQMSERHHQEFLATMTAALAPLTSKTQTVSSSASAAAAKINPAARQLETELLPSPSEVVLSHFINWKRKFILNAAANKIADESYESRCAFVSHALHSDWMSLIHSKQVKWEDTFTLEQQLDAIGSYLKEKVHPLLDRVSFLTRAQRQSESSESFLQALRILFECTRYNEEVRYPISEEQHQNLMLRDCYLAGLRNPDLRVHILKNKLDELSLERTLELTHSFEYAQNASDHLSTKHVRATRKSTYKQQQSQAAIDRRQASEPPADSDGAASPTPTGRPLDRPPSGPPRPSAPPGSLYKHRACGSSHEWGRNCPAAKHACANCNSVGHFENSGKCPAIGHRCGRCGQHNHTETSPRCPKQRPASRATRQAS